PEEHRAALIHELGPIVVQLVVRDPLGVIDAPIQRHVETKGEEAHGADLYVKRAHRAMGPIPVGIGGWAGARYHRVRGAGGPRAGAEAPRNQVSWRSARRTGSG